MTRDKRGWWRKIVGKKRERIKVMGRERKEEKKEKRQRFGDKELGR